MRRAWLPLSLVAFLFIAVLPGVTPLSAQDQRPITLEVDAREAPRKIFHAKLKIPAKPGALTLLYPKWIPGEHGPTGPIADVAGLKITAGGKTIPWRRDPLNMYGLEIEVPAGADAVEVSLDFLSPAETGGFSFGSSATANLALISWNQLLLYPKGAKADETTYDASVELPAGWKFATALETERQSGARVEFQPVSLTTLVDSPLLAGRNFRVVELSAGEPRHRLDMAADSEAALEISPELTAAYKNLVAETGVLFGSRPYRHYDFLLTLSDHTAHFGLEHHESSDNRVPERSLLDSDKRRVNLAFLLPHEMVHTWNAKYRRPAIMAIGKLDEPVRGDLLWVYEGLTTYLGNILTARSGLWTPEEYRQALAASAADMDSKRGRTWRPLVDTAVSAQILFGARSDGAAWRRGVDFYPESELLWLEADAVIRRETKGKKSLDDFCRLFHGGHSGSPKVVPYTFDDIVAALNQVAPYNWKGFWTSRLDATTQKAPLAGIETAGWKLVYRDTQSEFQKSVEAANGTVDVRFSVGFALNKDGLIPDVIPESPAANAGIGPGMKLLAVNGRRWSKDILRDGIRETRRGKPLELLVENGEFFQTHKLDYAVGERYPHLERELGKPDVLTEIIRAKKR